MQYISGVSGKSVEVVRVKERMTASNPILEGFGNAKVRTGNDKFNRTRAEREGEKGHSILSYHLRPLARVGFVSFLSQTVNNNNSSRFGKYMGQSHFRAIKSRLKLN